MKLQAFTGVFFLFLWTIPGCKKDHNGPSTPPPMLPPDTLMNWQKMNTAAIRPSMDIWFTDAAHGIICTADSALYRSQDSGKTWQKIPGLNKSFINLFFLNSQQGFVIGDTLAMTLDGGQTWAYINSPPANLKLLDVSFTSPANGYIISNGGTFKTTDSARTWIKVHNDPSTALYFFNKDTGYIYSKIGSILKTTDGGASWREAAKTMGNVPISILEFADRNHSWFAATSILYFTTDGWATSRQMQMPATYITDIQFFDNLNGYLLTTMEIYKTTDGGNTWTRQCKLGSGGFIEFYFLNTNTGWACGSAVLRLNQ